MQSTGLPRFTRPHVHRSGPSAVSKSNTVYEAVAVHEAACVCRNSRNRSRSRPCTVECRQRPERIEGPTGVVRYGLRGRSGSQGRMY
jgi:hypothetical protein